MTTGGGGMLVTNDAGLAERAKHLSTQAKRDAFEYYHDEIGYNYRLTNVQAAIGCAQIERLDEFVQRKREKALLYKELLAEVQEIKFFWERDHVFSNFWFYTVKVPAGVKKGLMNHLINAGIQVRPLWKLIHILPMYHSCRSYKIEEAFEAYDTCFNVPCSVGLGRQDVDYVVEAIQKHLRKA